MRYFIDTEYLWNAQKGQIEPVSIALVSEDGQEFYAVSTAFKARHADQWVKDNVLAKLPKRHADYYDSPRLRMESLAWMAPEKIREGILAFIGPDIPEFWGDYAAFDYVALSMLMGGFEDWPEGWPMFINDCQQVPGLTVPPSATPHNALADARAIRDGYNAFCGL